jgi:heme/copper-type cytochrome/quinol oxidase subunit 2
MFSIRNSLVRTSALASGLLFSAKAWAITLSTIPGIEGQSDITTGFVNIINAAIDFVGIIILLLIVISGFRLLLSQGDEAARDGAKKTIIYLIIGLIVIVFAKAIATFILNTVVA